MGITGLIPFLEKSSCIVTIAQYAGCTVAVDAYCWLHKGAFSCAEKLARGDKTDQYVQYCMKFINMLLSHNIKPIMVFDGRHLPAKAGTEKKRRESREVNRRRAAELLRQDRPGEAKTFLQRCVDVTHAMALELMKACRSRNVDCITAPYEADAQLAYLNINGLADVVVTEDSDLLLFGCTRVLFKLDLAGRGILVERDRLHLAMSQSAGCFDFDKFRYMCILSGCDYLPSLPGIGLVKACRFVKSTRDPDIHRALSRLGSHLNMSLHVPPEYRDQFLAADAMFRHQPVFDPVRRRLVPLTPAPDGSPPPPLLAQEPLASDQLCDLAYGNLDPFTLRRVGDWTPDSPRTPTMAGGQSRGWSARALAPHQSIWSADYQPRPAKMAAPVEDSPTPRPNLSSAVRVVEHSLALPKPSLKRPLVEPAEEMSELRKQFPDTPRPAQPTKRVCPSDSDILDMLERADTDPTPPDLPPPVPLHQNNPFAKHATPPSSGMMSGLSKLSQLRRTPANETSVVQSRYFGSQNTSQQNDDNTHAGSLKDVSNVMKKLPKASPETKHITEKSDDIATVDLSGDAIQHESESNSTCGKENLTENLRPKQESSFKWKPSLTDKYGFKSKAHPSTPAVSKKFALPSKSVENSDDAPLKEDVKTPKGRRNPFAIVTKTEDCLGDLNSQGSSDFESPSSCSQQEDLTPDSSGYFSSQESVTSAKSRPRLSVGLSKRGGSGGCQKTLTMFAFIPKASIKH